MAIELPPASGTAIRPDQQPAPESPGAAVDGPLLPDADDLRAAWQRLQAAFVDDPRGSVTEAAELVEHVAQALTGALHQRQRLLREQWDTEGEAPDTEELRLTIRRYRAVFNHLCPP